MLQNYYESLIRQYASIHQQKRLAPVKLLTIRLKLSVIQTGSGHKNEWQKANMLGEENTVFFLGLNFGWTTFPSVLGH
jgi:hypothetical protein